MFFAYVFIDLDRVYSIYDVMFRKYTSIHISIHIEKKQLYCSSNNVITYNLLIIIYNYLNDEKDKISNLVHKIIYL